MNRQGSHSFTIDALMSPTVSSRIGPSLYNSGYVFMPPTGNLNLLRGLSGYTGSESVLSSAMMHYTQTPFPPFPLMSASSGLYPGHLHSAFTTTGFPGLPARSPTSALHSLEQTEKLLKRTVSESNASNEDEDLDMPNPTDLRTTSHKLKHDDNDIQQETMISHEDFDDQKSDISIEGNPK